MDITTYSFLDLTGSISHPLAGEYLFMGQMGMGSLNIDPSTENTVQDIAADGSAMISKVLGTNATISLEMQQTSDLHKYLLRAWNLVYYSPDSSMWAAFSLYFRNIVDGSNHISKGAAFQKKAGKPYQSQGQRVTWIFLVADQQDLIV